MIKLCEVNDIPDPGSRGFDTDKGKVFVVHFRGAVHLYRNQCPHQGVNLDWQPNTFLDMDNRMIQCAMHGALFKIDTGECIAGPCIGDKLTTANFKIKDGNLYLL